MISMLETMYQSGTRENMCLNEHLFWQTVVALRYRQLPHSLTVPSLRPIFTARPSSSPPQS